MLTVTLPTLARALQPPQATIVRSRFVAAPLLRQQARLKSTLTTIKPSPDAPRQVPTPILFLAAQAFQEGAQAKHLYAAFIKHFSAQGYESIVIDLDPEEVKGKTTSKDILDAYEKDMSSLLRTASPFPPVLFTGYLSSLIAEQYASSHPLSSLLLLDPPLSSARAHKAHQALLPTPFEEYNFEPRFPCRVIWSAREMTRQKAEAIPWYEAHRIEHAEEEKAGEALDKIVWEDVDKEGPEEVQKWLEEECGV